MRITQDEQMIINEINKQGRMLAAEQQKLARLEQRASLLGNQRALTWRPRAYTAEFSFVPGDKTAQVETFTVQGGRFQAHTISTAFSLVGQAGINLNPGFGPGQIANITCGEGLVDQGPSARQAFFDYFWSIRDTGSDFSLQDVKQPSVVLAGGHAVPLVLPVPMRLEVGASLEMLVDPFFSKKASVGAIEGMFSLTEYRLLVKFWGLEEVA